MMKLRNLSRSVLFVLILLSFSPVARANTVVNSPCTDTLWRKLNYSQADFTPFYDDASLNYGRQPLQLKNYWNTRWGWLIRFLIKIVDHKATPILLYILVFGFSAFILVKFLRGQGQSFIGSERDNLLIINEEGIQMEEADLNVMLRQQIAERNYNHAVRILFLQSVKLLAGKGIITLHEDKTNKRLSSEISDVQLRDLFLQLTRVYEYAWFGNLTIDKNDFELIVSQFANLKSSING